MMMNNILNNLSIMIKEPKCELEYNSPEELLIATVLAAQSTDKRVNEVTKVLFKKYNIFTLSKANIDDIRDIIKPCGTHIKKSIYIKNIAISLVKDYNGKVPMNRKYIESLSGVGRKTCNVVFSESFNIPAFAVDTHVKRVANRLGIINTDDVLAIEKKLTELVPKELWHDTHLRLVLFGRRICTSKKPKCDICLNKNICKYYKELNYEKDNNRY